MPRGNQLSIGDAVRENIIDTLHSETGAVERSEGVSFIKFNSAKLGIADGNPCLILFYEGKEICTVSGEDIQYVEGRIPFEIA